MKFFRITVCAILMIFLVEYVLGQQKIAPLSPGENQNTLSPDTSSGTPSDSVALKVHPGTDTLIATIATDSLKMEVKKSKVVFEIVSTVATFVLIFFLVSKP